MHTRQRKRQGLFVEWHRDLVEKTTVLHRRKAALNPVSGRATDLLNDLNQISPV